MKKEAAFKINSENGLVCPMCGGSNLHQGAVKHYCRTHEDDEVGMLTVVTGNTVAASSDLPMKESPSIRRNGLRIEMACEGCGDLITDLAIYQHKGTTYITWMYDEDV
jgi:hypothetical protein